MARTSRTRALNVPTGPVTVSLPQLFAPRSYQLDFIRAMPANRVVTPEKTRDRLCLKWHRKCGKDLTCFAMTAREMQARLGYYVHIFPHLKDGRPIIWDGKDENGIPFLDRIPPALVKDKSETELQIVMKPMPGQYGFGDPNAQGSVWQLRGADDPDSLRGPNYVGAVFSEWAQMDPYVWTGIIQPVLENNGGWAIFNWTPEGQNHAYEMFEMAKGNARWFTSKLTIDDTKRDAPGEDGKPCVMPERIEALRKEGVSEEIIQQEYYCSDVGFLRGTIFGDLITVAQREKRIGRFPYDSNRPVGVWMDIGRTDATAVWFYQRVGQQIVFIDYYEEWGEGGDFHARRIREKPYLISKVVMPHDARVTGWSASQSPEQMFARIFRGVTVSPKPSSVQMAIDMTRRMFSRFYFDEANCARGIKCLENWRRKWDEQRKDFSGEPIHDEFSHGAAAIYTGVYGCGDAPLEFIEDSDRNPISQETEFSIWGEGGVIQ